MGLHHSYTLLSPFYDFLVGKVTQGYRKTSFEKITLQHTDTVLISGIGSGLDISLLHAGPGYYGIDRTLSMLHRALLRKKEHNLDIHLLQGNVMQLPYQDNCFDIIVMHLILAVAPDPVKTLREAQRTLKPDGTILIMDKFLRPGQLAPTRKLLNLITRHVATRLDIVFEDVLSHCTQLRLTDNTAADKSGWFRHILLKKERLSINDNSSS